MGRVWSVLAAKEARLAGEVRALVPASRPGFWSPHISSLGRVTERQSLPSDCQFLCLSNTHFFILFSFYRCFREEKRGSGP